MQLKPLYSVRFRYPQAWDVEIKGPGGVEEETFLFAEVFDVSELVWEPPQDKT